MTGHGDQPADKVGGVIKKGWGTFHGAGEAIRGNFNQLADSLLGGNKTGEDKNRNIAERGEREIKTGHYEGTGAGVTPADTDAERVNREAQGEPRNHS
ncbi:MAG: hypothetical protein M1821_001411 [Bathelium mastoideum]|nr:MAG: hypothetical protein M1821_001411 [Bathelium mastoideum]KAI9689939.1 MAG: hypothetical protein M1822_009821 [Bathelium mastoideum]